MRLTPLETQLAERKVERVDEKENYRKIISRLREQLRYERKKVTRLQNEKKELRRLLKVEAAEAGHLRKALQECLKRK